MVRNPVQSARSGIGPFASHVLNLTQSIDKKSENLLWEKWRCITDIDKLFLTLNNIFTQNTNKLPYASWKTLSFQRNSVLGPKRYFSELIASCSFMPTSPNMYVHYVGPNTLVFIHKKTYFKKFWLVKPLKTACLSSDSRLAFMNKI